MEGTTRTYMNGRLRNVRDCLNGLRLDAESERSFVFCPLHHSAVGRVTRNGACIMCKVIDEMTSSFLERRLNGAVDFDGGRSSVGEEPQWNSSCNALGGNILYSHGGDVFVLDITQIDNSKILFHVAVCLELI